MPFGVVSGVGRRIGILVIVEGEGVVLVVNDVGRLIVTNGDFVA